MSYQAPLVLGPVSLPWDLDRVVTGALDVLRLDPGDADAVRIANHAQVATRRIEQYLDLESMPDEWLTIPIGMAIPPIPPDMYALPPELYEAAVNLTVELLPQEGCRLPGVLDSWSADGAFTRISSDVMRGVRDLVARHRGRWGVA